jgi:hypothetical protein
MVTDQEKRSFQFYLPARGEEREARAAGDVVMF